ncbi:MAG: histidine kinase dimerization/phospho-acceptor domain-containing protein, partial [Melioribacteraceae bacterium]
MRVFKNILIQPKSFILIFVITAIIVLSSAVIELNQSKSEMLELMEKQGLSILETVLKSSDNALLSYNKIEEEIKQRLLNNAFLVKLFYEKGNINNALLEKISSENNIYRINIFDRTGRKIFNSHKDIHNRRDETENPLKYIQPIIDGDADTLILGIKKARFLDEERFAVALATYDRKAIVVNIKAEDLMRFRREVGFGVLLKKVTENPQFIYAALQDENGVIAGSGNLDGLKSLEQDPFLQPDPEKNSYKWRILRSDSLEVFEVSHPFIHNGEVIGVFRLGLSMDPLNIISQRLTRRIIIITILLFIFGFVTTILVFLRQNYNILSNRYTEMESYSTSVVENVSDGIIVVDDEKKIKMLNGAAEMIFSVNESETKGKLFGSIFPSTECANLMDSAAGIREIECVINGKPKIFLLSISKFSDAAGTENKILVFRDLTELKYLEKQARRNEKMVAMGELSSSVAHEIRNPLNSIGTIAQQLGKDFEVKENQEEFETLAGVVYKEVRRINEAIETFLQFARPQPVNAGDFNLTDFFVEIEKQYSSHLAARDITIEIHSAYHGKVKWDARQMKQVFVNLIENSIDSQPEGGRIRITAS